MFSEWRRQQFIICIVQLVTRVEWKAMYISPVLNRVVQVEWKPAESGKQYFIS